MATKTREPRKKHYLLTACALSAGSLLVGCGSGGSGAGGPEPIPMPGNPKGSVYPDTAYMDAASPADAGVPDAELVEDYIPLPGNPKGSLYVDDAYQDDE